MPRRGIGPQPGVGRVATNAGYPTDPKIHHEVSASTRMDSTAIRQSCYDRRQKDYIEKHPKLQKQYKSIDKWEFVVYHYNISAVVVGEDYNESFAGHPSSVIHHV